MDEFEIEQVVGQAGQVPCIYIVLYMYFFFDFSMGWCGALTTSNLYISTKNPFTTSMELCFELRYQW